MYFDYIELENFRQYKNTKIDFSRPEKEKNFIVIQGANGAGKTNILNAVTWCLYGEELHIGKKYPGLPVLNIDTFKELGPGKNCEVKVEIRLVEKNDRKIVLKRTLNFRKTEKGDLQTIPDIQSPYSDGSTLIMMRQTGKEWVPVSDPRFIINRLIPRSIQQFFFFDGEQLDEYFKGTAGKDIYEAISKVSQIGLLERVIEHLSKMEDSFIRNVKGLSSNAEEIRTRLETYKTSLNSQRSELTQKEDVKREAEIKEEEFSSKLRKSSVSRIPELEKQRNLLKEDLKKLESQIDDFESQRFDSLLKFAPIIFSHEALSSSRDSISVREEAGEIPPDYKRHFIEQLIKKGKCICGIDISDEEDKYRKEVERLLRDCSEISEISDEIISLNVEIGSMIGRIKDFKEQQERHGKNIKILEEDRQQKSKLLKQIDEEIAGTDVEQIKQWEMKRLEWQKIKEGIIGDIGAIKKFIERYENIQRVSESELKRELQKEGRYNRILEKLEFCKEAKKAASEIKDKIIADVRRAIEEETRKEFFGLIWKKQTYLDVKLDEDYNISVLHQSGREGIGTLSAGERQVLALSFMAALNSVSGFDVPIMIDTPLGRLSSEPKKNIAENLPNYLKGKQVSLLVTEEEYTPQVRERLFERVGRSYIIKFEEREEGNLAEVVPFVE